MTKAKSGDTVWVHYAGKLVDGTVFDSSFNNEPLQLIIGEGEVMPGFEQAVIGMVPGEAKTVNISAEQAYGPYHKEKVLKVKRERFPSHLDLRVGKVLRMRRVNEKTTVSYKVIVTDVSETSVTVDANHPFAGEDFIFDIQLLEIVEDGQLVEASSEGQANSGSS